MKKSIGVIALLLMIMLTVCSCGDNSDTADNVSDAGSGSTSQPVTDGKLIANSDGTQYKLIYPKGQDMLNDICSDMKTAIFNAVSKNVFAKSDESEDPTQYEILVGRTNRAESRAVYRTLSDNEYRIVWQGDKLVVTGGSNLAAWQAARWLYDNIVSAVGEDGLYISASIDVKGSINNMFDFKSFDAGWNICRYISDGTMISFLIHMPEGYDESKEYPLMLFLHGDGNVGKNVADVLANGEAVFARRAVKEKPDSIVIVPASTKTWLQVPKDTDRNIYGNYSFGEVTPSSELLAVSALVDECIEKLAVDADRVYLSGYSKGCMSSWYLMAKEPNKYAAAAIACGSGDVSAVSKFSHIPVWVFMGDVDTVVSYDDVKAVYDAYTAAGGEGRFTTCTGLGHGVSSTLEKEKELIGWLYSQKRS